ncbi:MAG: DUF4270 family protein [Ginsengibacter sp.]
MMKKITAIYSAYRLSILILLTTILFGCEKTKIQFGQDFTDNSYSNIILVDTITAELSTVYSDSVPTSASGTMLAGDYVDNIFGKVTAKSFFEVSPPAFTELPTSSTFDSLELILRPGKTYYGDTTYDIQLSVYQLKNELLFPLYQTQFFNNNDFDVDPVPLGSINTLLSPNNTDSISIRLNDATGKNLFELYKSKDYAMQSTPNFLTYFKGLQLAASSTGMHAVYGFHDSVIMRLHYHVTDIFSENKFLDFPFYNNDNKQFNQVKTERSGTPLSVFNSTNNEVVSTSTNNTAFIQPLTGLMAKVKFPTIRNLLLRPDYLKILKAELVVKPVKGSYNGNMPLPTELLAYTTDQRNFFGSPLASVVSGASASETGNLTTDPIYNENTFYTYDVTSYLQQQILVSTANQNGLLLAPPVASSIAGIRRAIIGDQKNTQGPLQLKIYYVSVNP